MLVSLHKVQWQAVKSVGTYQESLGSFDLSSIQISSMITDSASNMICAFVTMPGLDSQALRDNNEQLWIQMLNCLIHFLTSTSLASITPYN